jgi:hypothetical protein
MINVHTWNHQTPAEISASWPFTMGLMPLTYAVTGLVKLSMDNII